MSDNYPTRTLLGPNDRLLILITDGFLEFLNIKRLENEINHLFYMGMGFSILKMMIPPALLF